MLSSNPKTRAINEQGLLNDVERIERERTAFGGKRMHGKGCLWRLRRVGSRERV